MNIESVENLRDLGGIIAKDGRRIKKNILIRSGALHKLSEKDVGELKKAGLRRVIDLRSGLERREKPDIEIDGVENIHLPIFSETVLGISRDSMSVTQVMKTMWMDMPYLYRGMVERPEASERFSRVLSLIIEQKDGAVLWHCSAGKDRCGLTAALCLHMLGADRDTIFADYLESNKTAAPFAEMIYRKVLAESGDGQRAEYMRHLFMADREYLEASLERMDLLYGGIDGFIHKGLKITDAQIEAFRERCLE